jgi:hypothetical protein
VARSGGWRLAALRALLAGPTTSTVDDEPILLAPHCHVKRPTPQGRIDVASRSSQLDGWLAMKGTDR